MIYLTLITSPDYFGDNVSAIDHVQLNDLMEDRLASLRDQGTSILVRMASEYRGHGEGLYLAVGGLPTGPDLRGHPEFGGANLTAAIQDAWEGALEDFGMISTLTDEQIDEMRGEAQRRSDFDTVRICDMASDLFAAERLVCARMQAARKSQTAGGVR